MIWLLALAAHAADPDLHGEVVGEVHATTEVVSFAVPRCERVKAIVADDRPHGMAASVELVVTLENQGSAMCLFKGVALEGTLAGTYTSSQNTPDGTGLFVAPHARLALHLKPDHPELPRVAISLWLPPDAATIVLRGLTPGETVPVPTVP